MKENNVLLLKSYEFAVKIVRICQILVNDRKEFVLSKQLLKSGTSIGANAEEAIGGQTTKDFYAKINIVYKEARETHYWLRLLRDTGYLDETSVSILLSNCEEILKITGSIIKTLKDKQNYNH